MKRRKKLLWQLFPSYLVIILAGILAVTLYALKSVHSLYTEQIADNLAFRAEILSRQARERMRGGDLSALDFWVKSLRREFSARITLILPSGKVVADSDADVRTMDSHDDRPEVIGALKSGMGESKRYSYTLGQTLMYLAVPVRDGKQILAVLRLSLPLKIISRNLNAVYLQIGLAGFLVALAATGANLLLSRRITRPLEEMKRGADRFARGELQWRLPVPETDELATLAEGLNSMARQLDERIRTLMHQRNEQQAVLSSMVEGVLAVDIEERIISVNQAGAQLLEVDPGQVSGRSILEVVRNTDLQRFVARTLTSREPVEGDIVLHDNGGRFLQAHGTILHDGQDNAMGAVIVLNDVTRLRRLETVRRDFVANVSHELKTPITSIKGFVETLLDGALDRPEDARRFLEIIARQTDRLNAIIEDILALSRMEDMSEKDRIRLEPGPIKEILDAALQICQLQAGSKNIQIHLACDDTLTARMNGPLLEQAVVNLIDNAVKYSEPGSEVHVEGLQTGPEILIHVRDRGCGIEKEYQPRIFERFYRVDKARSRKLGGTGLGLAIVKHIALAHGGSVTVDSTPGQGSTFTLRLPV